MKVMMSKLTFLLYASQALNSLEENARLSLEKKSALYSDIKDITGVLVYRQGFFMQYLEGQESSVLDIFRKLRGHEHHFNVKVLSRGLIDRRLFSNWTMRVVKNHQATPSSQSLIDLFETVLSQNTQTSNEINLVLNRFWKDSEILHLNL